MLRCCCLLAPLGGGRGSGDGHLVEKLLVNLSPVLPLLDNLLAVEQHRAEDDTRGVAAALLPVVHLQGIPNVLWKGAVQHVLQLVQVVGRAPLAELVKELWVVLLGPRVDLVPRALDRRRGWHAVLEGLQGDHAGGALRLEVIARTWLPLVLGTQSRGIRPSSSRAHRQSILRPRPRTAVSSVEHGLASGFVVVVGHARSRFRGRGHRSQVAMLAERNVSPRSVRGIVCGIWPVVVSVGGDGRAGI